MDPMKSWFRASVNKSSTGWLKCPGRDFILNFIPGTDCGSEIWRLHQLLEICTWNSKQLVSNGCFNWMIPNHYSTWKISVSPNLHLKLVVWGSRYIKACWNNGVCTTTNAGFLPAVAMQEEIHQLIAILWAFPPPPLPFPQSSKDLKETCLGGTHSPICMIVGRKNDSQSQVGIFHWNCFSQMLANQLMVTCWFGLVVWDSWGALK